MLAEPHKTTSRNITLLLGSTLTVMAGATIAPSLPDMSLAFQDVPNADLMVKLVLTVPALFVALGAPICGVLLDRYGRKPVLVSAMILYGLAGSAGYVLGSIHAILISRAVLGLAVAGTMTGSTTLIADYFVGTRLSSFMGLQGGFMGFGGVVFLLLGGILADIGWRVPFLLYLSAFIILPGALFFVIEPQVEQGRRRGYRSPSGTSPRKHLIQIYAMGFVGMAIFYMVPVHLPFFLRSLQVVNNTQVGMAIASMTLVSAFVAVRYHSVKQRLSFQNVFALGFLLMGVGYAILASSGSFRAALVGLVVSGMGLGMIMPNLNVYLITVIPSGFRGRAVGGLATCVYLGQFSSPLVTEPIARYVGIASGFGAAGVVMLVLAAVFFRPRAPKTHAPGTNRY
jgi:MFS family permease